MMTRKQAEWAVLRRYFGSALVWGGVIGIIVLWQIYVRLTVDPAVRKHANDYRPQQKSVVQRNQPIF